MSHPVYPTFPTEPPPEVGDTFTPEGTDQVWTFLGGNLGWVKTVVERNHQHPVWPGRIISND